MATSPIAAFNNQLLSFIEDIHEIYPEDSDIKTALDAVKMLKKMNPKKLHALFMEIVYANFKQEIREENIEGLLAKAKEYVSREFSEFMSFFVVFDKYWGTMTETNRKHIWDYCKVLLVLGERANTS